MESIHSVIPTTMLRSPALLESKNTCFHKTIQHNIAISYYAPKHDKMLRTGGE